MARTIVLGPIALLGELFRLAKPPFQVFHPFIYLVGRLKNERPNKATKPDRDLRGVDDNSLDWSPEGDLTSDGVKGYLIVRFKLLEIVTAECGGGRFPVHDEGLILEVNDSVEVSTEDIGVFEVVLETDLELEVEFHHRLSSIWVKSRLGRVIFEFHQIPHYCAD